MECTFCDIIEGRRPADVVFEEPGVVAFLDHRPLFPGHVLVSPLEHHETLETLPHRLVEPLFSATRRLAVAVRLATEAEGTFVALNNRVSQSVPHLHVHVVPRRRGDGLRGFFWPRSGYRDADHRREVANAIRRALTGD